MDSGDKTYITEALENVLSKRTDRSSIIIIYIHTPLFFFWIHKEAWHGPARIVVPPLLVVAVADYICYRKREETVVVDIVVAVTLLIVFTTRARQQS
jgi:hypothetical protein